MSNSENSSQNPFEDFCQNAMNWQEDSMSYTASQAEISCATVHPFVNAALRQAHGGYQPLSALDAQMASCLSKTLTHMLIVRFTALGGTEEDQLDADDPEFIVTLKELEGFAFDLTFWLNILAPMVRKLWDEQHEPNH